MGLLTFFVNVCLLLIRFSVRTQILLVTRSSSFSISVMPSPINCCKSEFQYFLSFHLRAINFSKTNVNAIRKAVNYVASDRSLNELNIDERVKFLTECALNIFHSFLPSKVIIIRNKDAL